MKETWRMIAEWHYVKYIIACCLHIAIVIITLISKNKMKDYMRKTVPNDTIWRQRSGSTLAAVMVCCLTAPNHYLSFYLSVVKFCGIHQRAILQQIPILQLSIMSLIIILWNYYHVSQGRWVKLYSPYSCQFPTVQFNGDKHLPLWWLLISCFIRVGPVSKVLIFLWLQTTNSNIFIAKAYVYHALIHAYITFSSYPHLFIYITQTAV